MAIHLTWSFKVVLGSPWRRHGDGGFYTDKVVVPGLLGRDEDILLLWTAQAFQAHGSTQFYIRTNLLSARPLTNAYSHCFLLIAWWDLSECPCDVVAKHRSLRAYQAATYVDTPILLVGYLKAEPACVMAEQYRHSGCKETRRKGG